MPNALHPLGCRSCCRLTFQPASDPRGVAAAIEDSMHDDVLALDAVVDPKWELLGKRRVITEHDFVNARVQRQRVDLRIEIGEEIVTESGRLSLVELIPLE